MWKIFDDVEVGFFGFGVVDWVGGCNEKVVKGKGVGEFLLGCFGSCGEGFVEFFYEFFFDW